MQALGLVRIQQKSFLLKYRLEKSHDCKKMGWAKHPVCTLFFFLHF